MHYTPSIHNAKHLAKAVLGRAEQTLGLSFPAGELLVLNYHGTQKKYLGEFEKQLDFLAKKLDFVSPAFLNEFYSGANASARPKVLLTFDDGIKNNLHAAELLAARNIRALFLIVPGFVDCPEKEQHDFFVKNIRPVINPVLDHLPEDTAALSWDELKHISRLGHDIGSHSATHTLETGKFSAAELEKEIVESKNRIEEMLNIQVTYFCAPNNSLLSCGIPEMRLIKQHYRFFLSTFPGSNAGDKNPFFIRRSNVEAHWMKGAFIRAIGNWDQERWRPKIESFRKIAG